MLLALISGWRGLRGTSKLSLDRHHRYPPLQSAQGMGHPSVRNGLEKSKACATRQCEILLNFVWREGSRSVAITSTTVAEYRRPPRQCLLRFCPSRDGQVIRMEQTTHFPYQRGKYLHHFLYCGNVGNQNFRNEYFLLRYAWTTEENASAELW